MQRVGEGLSRTMARFSKNWLVKIVCLAFAVFLSQFYRGTLQDTRYMFVPLVLQNDGPLAPAEQYPGKIKVSVWGDANSIGSIGERKTIPRPIKKRTSKRQRERWEKNRK